jgi:hypothetical protein
MSEGPLARVGRHTELVEHAAEASRAGRRTRTATWRTLALDR